MPQQDDPLERRFAHDPAAVFDEVFERYSGTMFAIAKRVLGDRHLAADAVQIAFMQAWRAADRFDPDRSLAQWLLTIARRAAIDVYRHHYDRGRHRAADPQTWGHRQSTTQPADELMLLRWRANLVRSAIEGLPAGDRAVVTLVHLNQLSQREAATTLGVPLGTVKSRLFRAHRRLALTLHQLNPGDNLDARPSHAD
jgi:RNA polymerase sigma-70 factor, ECF subfamily